MVNERKNSVLIVDDENSNIMALTHILSPEYTVYAAKSGQSALAAAQKHMPDVILLDVIMPEMDGYAVISKLKNITETKNIPVIFITGLSDADDEEKGLALGAADYIPKPFSPALVKLRVLNQIKLIEQFHSNEYDIMKYKLSNDALNIALWDMDVISGDPVNPGNRFTWSQEFRHMLGFSGKEDFPDVFHSWSGRLHPGDREKVLSAFEAHLNDQTGKTPYDIECRLKMKNGEYRCFRALGATRRDNTGAPIRAAGALMDITEQKRMEREIAQAMEKIKADAHWYMSILDAIPLPVSVTDADMNWTFVNKAVEDFLGTKREDMFGKHCGNWNSSICNTGDCGIACAKRGLKRTFFNKEDSSYQIDVEILRNIQGETAGFIEVVQDITNVQKLAQQRAEAEITSQSKSAFLANMSHEIRTPMNAIWGITEILMQNDTLPRAVMEGLGRIHSSCHMLLGIINDILDFSKIEAGKLDIMPSGYDVASIINDSIQLNIMRAGDKPVEFKVQVDENIPAQLIGDELRIKQILNNLLSNAFKYTDTGTVTLTASSEPDGEGATLILSVRDTGHGMTRKQVEKLFEEYSRFNVDGGRTIEGTGLGMAITYRLLSLMNGDIHVESKPGKGSLFTVRLPQGVADAGVMGSELAESLQKFSPRYMTGGKKIQVVREPMPYGSVLVVDDVETNLYVAEGLMKPYKLKIDTAASGIEAIDRVKSGKVYDIIFMDHMMPEMDGIEAAKRIRALDYTNPVVALTANAVVGQADLFLQNGFDAFISKPIDIRNLNAVLNKFIRDKQPAEVIEAALRQTGARGSNDGGQPGVNPLLLESFISDARKTVTILEDLSQNDGIGSEEGLRKLTAAVHGIKSALASIGESGLSEAARKLDLAGRNRDAGMITDSFADFLNGLRTLLEKLEPKREADGADGDIAALREKLLDVQELCADYNRKGALDILAEIKQKGCSNKTQAAIDGIIGLVLHSEFDEAESAAALYASGLMEESQNGIAALISKKEIAGLDIAKGLERYDGDGETYLKILRSYAASIRPLLGATGTIGGDGLASYEITVHGIKGASRDIYAGPVGESAWELEKAAKTGDLDYINKNTPAFLESAWKLINDLDAMLLAINAENPKPKKDKPDSEALSRLLEACEMYDMDGVDAAMAEIDGYQYEADGGLAEWLRENADIMNFEQIVQRLAEQSDKKGKEIYI